MLKNPLVKKIQVRFTTHQEEALQRYCEGLGKDLGTWLRDHALKVLPVGQRHE